MLAWQVQLVQSIIEPTALLTLFIPPKIVPHFALKYFVKDKLMKHPKFCSFCTICFILLNVPHNKWTERAVEALEIWVCKLYTLIDTDLYACNTMTY